MALSVACLHYWKNGKVMLAREKFLGHFWLTFYCQDASLWVRYKSIKINKRLSKRTQRTTVRQEYSSWNEIKYGIAQASKPGAIFFKIKLCDLFFIIKDVDVVNFADDNPPYMSANNLTNLVENLEDSACLIFKWRCANNQIQGNATKFHVSLSTKEKVITKADSAEAKNSQSEKLLRATIGSQLCFEKHANRIIKQRLNTVYYLAQFLLWISTRTKC